MQIKNWPEISGLMDYKKLMKALKRACSDDAIVFQSKAILLLSFILADSATDGRDKTRKF